MAKARAIDRRRKAVRNIRKITRTMQLIATARFQSAYTRAVATKPYVENISRLIEEVSRSQGDIEHPLLRVNDQSKKTAIIVLTSTRGLCGGYNSALLRLALEHVRAEEAAGRTVELHTVGKKGISYFKFLNRKMAWTATTYEGPPAFADVEKIAENMMDAYSAQQFDAVHVAYTRFFSAAVQRPEVLQLLPIRKPGAEEGQSTLPASASAVQYEFSPPAEQLLAELLPEVVKVRLYQAFNDAAVSEQTSRMVAMKAATDAAGDTIRSLTQQLNRARQSQITLELLDIVSGAEALA